MIGKAPANPPNVHSSAPVVTRVAPIVDGSKDCNAINNCNSGVRTAVTICRAYAGY